MLRAPVTQQLSSERSGLRADALDVRRADDGDGDAGDALRENDVALARIDDRLLVARVGAALGGGDEARAELRARVARVERAHEVRLVADPAGADEREPEDAALVEQLLRGAAAGVAAGA